MQFTKISLSAAALIAYVRAAEFTNPSFTGITAGSPFTITWSGASTGVTILLKNGPSTNLVTVTTIASGLSGGSYTWTPGTSLASGTYALEIDVQGQDPNYSAQFTITGGLTTTTTTTSASITTGTSSTSDSSSSSSSTDSTSFSTTSSLSSTTTSISTSLNSTTLAASTTTANGTAIVSPTGGNTTASTATLTGTSTTTGSSGSKTSAGSASGASSSSTSTSSSSGAAGLASPMALVLLGVAALAFLN